MAEQNELKEKLAADTAERRDLTWNSLIDQNVKMHKASPRLAFDIGYELAYQDGYAAGQPQWVDVADGLPKYTDHYLVVINGVTWMAFWAACEDGGFIWQDVNPDNDENLQEVTAWQPLPAPYQRPSAVEGDKNDE